MVEIKLKNLSRSFGSLKAVNNLNYTFDSGEVTCLLGPSGCGKTTLLRIIAGLLNQTEGDVYFQDSCVNNLRPKDRNIGMVFQYPVIFSGLDVSKNIELPLRRENLSSAEIKKRVDSVVDLLSLSEYMNLMVTELDNGTRQKVAVAREVARQPKILLFDEPITNIDANNKLEFKRAFKVMTENLKQTIIYVTHDQTEAMTLADRIALMKDGNIIQYEKPRNIYSQPADIFAGWFLGNPGMNFFKKQKIEIANGKLTFDNPAFPFKCNDIKEESGLSEVILGIRPEDITICEKSDAETLEARVVKKNIAIGGQYLLRVVLGKEEFRIKTNSAIGRSVGEKTFVKIPPQKVSLFTPEGKRIFTKLENK